LLLYSSHFSVVQTPRQGGRSAVTPPVVRIIIVGASWWLFAMGLLDSQAGGPGHRSAGPQATIHQAANICFKTLPSAAVMKLAQDYANSKR
jgi:hypothetical protein